MWPNKVESTVPSLLVVAVVVYDVAVVVLKTVGPPLLIAYCMLMMHCESHCRIVSEAKTETYTSIQQYSLCRAQS